MYNVYIFDLIFYTYENNNSFFNTIKIELIFALSNIYRLIISSHINQKK